MFSQSALSQNEQLLQSKFRNLDISIIRFVLNSVSAGNVKLAQETLASLTAAQIAQIKSQLTGQQLPLTPEQQNLIVQFKDIAGCSRKVARKYMENNAWNVNVAIDMYFQNGGLKPEDLSDGEDEQQQMNKQYQQQVQQQGAQEQGAAIETLEHWFDTFRAEDRRGGKAEHEFSKHMQSAALEAFVRKLGVGECDASPMVLKICFLVGAKTGSKVLSKDEFCTGLRNLGCETLEELTPVKMVELSKQVDEDYRRFYRFVYEFVCPSRRMKPTTAVTLWNTLLPDQVAKHQTFCHFFQTNFNGTVTKDLWNECYDFLEQMKPDYSNYNEREDCWPSVLDKFVAEQFNSASK